MTAPRSRLRCVPATPARWDDLARLFGDRGACAGCWCMWPRLPGGEFTRGRGAGNRRALRGLVRSGARPGIIAYRGREPVGWCAVAPREQYVRLARSRVMAPVDGEPVWSIVCFFVARTARGAGVTTALLRAAVAHARQRGARIVEGYPLDPGTKRVADAFAWFGLAPAFRRAGFREVARRSPTRPLMRIETGARRPAARRGRPARAPRGRSASRPRG